MNHDRGFPLNVKWLLIAGVTAICTAAAALMIWRGPALLVDLGSALAACF